jgi:hypothetical protein
MGSEAVELEHIENVKENILPLARGRRVSVLKQVLQDSTTDQRDRKQ